MSNIPWDTPIPGIPHSQDFLTFLCLCLSWIFCLRSCRSCSAIPGRLWTSCWIISSGTRKFSLLSTFLKFGIKETPEGHGGGDTGGDINPWLCGHTELWGVTKSGTPGQLGTLWGHTRSWWHLSLPVEVAPVGDFLRRGARGHKAVQLHHGGEEELHHLGRQHCGDRGDTLRVAPPGTSPAPATPPCPRKANPHR